jgi:hypothetical protein
MRALAVAVLVTLAMAAPARADIPASRLVAIVGGRRNLGDLGDRYSIGYVYGLEAGYHWGIIGVAWSALGGTFPSSRPDNPENQLLTLEMELGARARFHLGGDQLKTFAITQVGAQIVRTSLPVEETRHHVGPSVGGGFEFILGDELIIMLGARYGLVPLEPSGVTVFLSIGIGGS